MSDSIFYVGTEAEVGHHAAPLISLNSNVQVAEPSAVLERAELGDVVVFYSEHFDRFRDLCVALKSRGIPTVYAIDGILEWRNAWENRADEIACPWTMRPCLADVVASIGPRQTSILKSWGNTNVHTIGIPRLDQLCSLHEADHSSSTSNKDRFIQAETIRILVVTAKFPGFTPKQIEITRQSLCCVKDQVDHWNRNSQGTNLQIDWRLTGGLDKELQVNSVTGPIQQCIVDADILISTASTALLEGMLLGKPTILLDFHQTPAYVPTAWHIQSEEQIRPILTEAIQTTSCSPKLQFQEFLLHEALTADGKSSHRFLSLLEAVRTRAKSAVENNEPCRFRGLTFDHQIDDATQPACQNVDSQSSFCDASEGLSVNQLNAYAHQLKRENDRLNRLLTEAHQVFDHMQSHPVLGTILKTHKWVNQTLFNRPGKMEKPSEMEDNH